MDTPVFLLKKIDVLLDATKNAASRTRYVFLTTIVSSIIIIFSLFNADMSWQRFLNSVDRKDFAKNHAFIPPGYTDDSFMYRIYAEIFLQRRTVVLPLLNIRCTVDDFSVIAGLGMVILVTWFFFSVRREHHTIQKVDATFQNIRNRADYERQAQFDLLDMVFHGCSQNFIFLTATQLDQASPVLRFKKNTKNRTGRLIVKLLHFIIPISLALILLSDINSIVQLKSHGVIDGQFSEALGRDIICFLGFLYCTYQCVNISKLNNKSINILSGMNYELENLEKQISPDKFDEAQG